MGWPATYAQFLSTQVSLICTANSKDQVIVHTQHRLLCSKSQHQLAIGNFSRFRGPLNPKMTAQRKPWCRRWTYNHRTMLVSTCAFWSFGQFRDCGARCLTRTPRGAILPSLEKQNLGATYISNSFPHVPAAIHLEGIVDRWSCVCHRCRNMDDGYVKVICSASFVGGSLGWLIEYSTN